MEEQNKSLYDKEYFEYLSKRNQFRKIVRKFYLRDIAGYCKGKTIDFGCGVGELLSMLPAGSAGYEINPVSVEYCISNGLDVKIYNPGTDDYQFLMIEKNKFTSFTMNHVLEHLDDSFKVVEKIFSACHRLGIERIVFTVPGHKGFQLDKTHRTFITKGYFRENNLFNNDFYSLLVAKYFPVNNENFSRYFTHNELRLVFDRIK